MVEELSINEAAKALGVHPGTVRRMIGNGEIIAEKRGQGRGQYYIPASAIYPLIIEGIKSSTDAEEERIKIKKAHKAAAVRTTNVITQTSEIDVKGLTNEIYEQRAAVIRLYDLISDLRISDIAISDQVRDISAKIDKLTLKLEPQGAMSKETEPQGAMSKETEPQGATSEQVEPREYWWQFWRPEK